MADPRAELLELEELDRLEQKAATAPALPGFTGKEARQATGQALRREVGLQEPAEIAASATGAPAPYSITSVGKKYGVTESQVQANIPKKRDPGIDYASGVKDAGIRAKFSLLDTDQERQSFLEKQFGKENVLRDSFGAWTIKPEGLEKIGQKSERPVTLAEQGASPRRAADLVGSIPSFVGGMLGGVAGSGPASVPLAALGAAGGKGIASTIKSALDLGEQTPGETAKTLAKEGAMSGIGQGAFLGLRGAGRAIMGGYSPTLTAEQKALAKEALDKGFVPSIEQSVPKSFFLGREQSYMHKFFGNPATYQNSEAMKGQLRETLAKGGIPEDQIEGALTRVMSGDVKAEAEGVALQRGVRKIISDANYAVQSATFQAKRVLDRHFENLDKSIGKGGAAPELIAKDLVEAKTVMNDGVKSLYKSFDDLVGRNSVPTKPLRDAALTILEREPESVALEGSKSFLEKVNALPEFVSAHDMQTYRGILSDGAKMGQLFGGRQAGISRHLAAGANESFEAAKTQLASMMDERALAGLDSLKAADKAFGEMMDVYANKGLAALTRGAQNGSVEMSQVVPQIVRDARPELLAKFMDKFTPQTQEALRREVFDRITQDASGEFLQGSKVLAKVEKMGATLDQLYGKRLAGEIRLHAKEMAALDGKLSVADLEKGHFRTAMGWAAYREKEAARLSGDSFIKSIARGGQEADEAFNAAFVPGGVQRVKEIKQIFGEASPEFQGLKQKGMEKILSNIVAEGESKSFPNINYVFDGKGLRTSLSRYGDKMLTELYGPQTVKDLHELARVAEYVTRSPSSSGGIAVANVMLQPFSHLGKLAQIGGMSWLLSKPGAVRYLTQGMQFPETEAGQRALSVVSGMSRAYAQGKATIDDETQGSGKYFLKNRVTGTEGKRLRDLQGMGAGR